jgi:sugar phosphate isomerase/epimerase
MKSLCCLHAKTINEEQKLKYAFCNEMYVDWPFEKAFAHANQLGYTGVEIAPFTINSDATQITQAQRQEVKSMAADNGLEVIGLHWLLAKTEGYHLTHDSQAIRDNTANYLCELARLCQDLGGNVMVFGSPPQRNLAEGVSYEQGFERATDVFKKVAPVLEDCGVTLALEPLGPKEGNFMLTAKAGIELAQAIDSPNVKLHLDVKAMSSESLSIPEIIHNSKDWLVHFHANDPNRRGPGMGDVDFVPIFEALDHVKYEGWISVEVFDYEPGVEALARESICYMQRLESQA